MIKTTDYKVGDRVGDWNHVISNMPGDKYN
jgi:hypothetical protein